MDKPATYSVNDFVCFFINKFTSGLQACVWCSIVHVGGPSGHVSLELDLVPFPQLRVQGDHGDHSVNVGHSISVHPVMSMLGPKQPSVIEQVRFRVLCPIPHVTEQEDHAPQLITNIDNQGFFYFFYFLNCFDFRGFW